MKNSPIFLDFVESLETFNYAWPIDTYIVRYGGNWRPDFHVSVNDWTKEEVENLFFVWKTNGFFDLWFWKRIKTVIACSELGKTIIIILHLKVL